MSGSLPAYLDVGPEDLGRGQPVRVRVVADAAVLAADMAEAMAAEIRTAIQQRRGATLIVPVGPVDQYPLLVEHINAEGLSCRDVTFVNMDEYLNDDGAWLAESHPLSFRAYMAREFYSRLDPALAPPPEHRVFPDPLDPPAIGRLIARRGGVDACFGGIGINGHIAFNEPPEPGQTMTAEEFAALRTSELKLARETRTINSVTVGGELSIVPRRAITVGMQEILASRRLRFYGNRPWQRAVVRRALHGPIEPACPASFLRRHPDAELTITADVAQRPEIRLR